MHTHTKPTHLYSQSEGQGETTVILESGAGDCHLTWSLVKPLIAKTNRVVSYDRGGLGLSEPTSEPRKLQQFTNELEQVLKKNDIKGPLILVGHSLGGLLMLHYAYTYPNDIAGIVLVDSSHEKQMDHPAISAKNSIRLTKLMLFFSRFGVIRLLAQMTLRKVNLDTKTINKYRSLQSSPKIIRALLAEFIGYVDGYKLIYDKLKPILKDKPLVVITRGKKLKGSKKFKEFDAYQKELQKKYLALSSKSKHVIAEKSGHFVQWTEPELIADTIHHIQTEYNQAVCQE